MPDAPETAATEGSEPPLRVLLVDNDPDHCRAMAESLERVGYLCTMATSGPEGARRLQQEVFDLVITDMVMNDVDGMQILARAKELLPEAEVIMVTGHATVPKAVEAMQLGAFNFLENPITLNSLRAGEEKAGDTYRMKRTNLDLHQRLDKQFGFEGIIYVSDKMK